MAAWLEEEIANKRLDIAIFQEVWTPWRSIVAASIHSFFCCQLFGRSLIEKTLTKASLGYFTSVGGSYPCDCTRRFFDSGLLIASRYPIIEQDFKIYPSGSPHDALSSKGILVAAVRRPEGILIVGSSHLDAGSDDEIKIRQLKIALDLLRHFSRKIAAKFPTEKIVGKLFGSDMNIDGVEFWNKDASYATVRALMEAEGYEDSWLLTPRDIPHADDVLKKNYGPDAHPQLGITSDQHNCVKRLDYIWVAPEVAPSLSPVQMKMLASEGLSKRSLVHHIGVSAKTSLNDGADWRSSVTMRREVDAALAAGDRGLARRLAVKIDLHDREERLSDHAALFANLRFHEPL